MKLLTNGNNINTLKVLIASNISKNSIKICQDSVESLNIVSPKAVPQLVLDSGTHIFSSNAAAKYLFLPSVQDLSAVNYYLDLEASLIQPMTISFSSKPSPFVKKNFEDVITALNEELSGKAYLAGEKVTVGDIAVWCSLYPVFTDSKLFSELFNFKESLKKWFEDINKLPYVQEALKQYPVEKGLPSLGSLVLTHSVKTGAPAKVQSEGNVPLQKGGLPKAPESPAKEAATVTITEDEKKAAALAWEEAPKKLSKKPAHPVLPVPGERNILITSALPYVNNVPHLGNIIGCVLSGDVFARYCRLRGYNTLYVCGTDEYGTATETKALEEELTPQQICDKYFKIHDSIYKWFNISFDHFGRTTTPEQTEICQDIFTKVYKNGYVLAESVEQLLCEKCDRYLADRYVEGTCPRCGYEDARGDQCDGCGHLINAPELIKPRCKICKETPVLRQSKQFFLDLPKIEPILKEWMQKSSMNWSHNAAEITKAWLNDGLKPRCITRDLKWGIPVPIEGFENKVFYVWFDAPIGYISITKLYTDEWRKWWLPEKNTEISLYQFMAKDNVPFHSVMFPASLIASKENYILVSNIFATEYLNYEEGKFSKSRGVGVFGTDAQDTGIPADIWRFYLLYVRPESQDSVFSWLDLALKNNSELLNILGNFINRSMVFCEKNYQSKVPKVNLIDEDYELLALVNREIKEYITMLEKGKLREGVRHILSIARLGNQLMQASQPWVLCKGTDDDKKRCGTVIGLSVNLSCLLAQLLYPYMPATSELIWKQLNSPPDVSVIEDKFRLYLSAGHEIGKPFPLFNKIEGTQIETLKAKFAGNQKAKSPPAGGDAVKVAAASTYSPSEHVASIETITQQLLLENAQNPAPGMNLENIEEEVKKQGDLVRKLKESGVDRSQWQPEVNVLLDLKKKLAELKGEPMQAPSGKKNKKK